MDFQLSDEHETIAQMARRFADDELSAVAARMDAQERFDPALIGRLGEHGFLGMLVPESFGGSGFDTQCLAIAIEELSRVCASTGVTVAVHNSLVTGPLLKFGSEDQKRELLPALAAGRRLGAYCVTESGAGSDVAAIALKAERDGDFYRLTGAKIFVTSGEYADLLVVFARTNPKSRSRGVTCFLVDAKTPGVRVSKKERKLGIRGSATNEIVFEDAMIPASRVLGRENEGFQIALDTLDGGRIGIGAQALGIGRACLEEAVQYAGERRQFGSPIADFQMVQWKIAEMAMRLDAARLLVMRAAWLKDQKKPHGKEASMAKLMASQTANFCAKEALQIHGGYGYITEFPIERHFRDARITEIYEGTSEVQKMVIARHVLGRR